MTERISFPDLVREAFIEPLRSVLIIDDQYPTWEEVFKAQTAGEDQSNGSKVSCSVKGWKSNPAVSSEVLALLATLRSKNPGLVIDIHNCIASGEVDIDEDKTQAQLASRLHQSGLLVLDYYLDGAESGLGGRTARSILNSILTSQHFNLVVVHTKEDLDNVFYECLLALMKPYSISYTESCKEEINNLDTELTLLEDDEEFNREELDRYFTITDYLDVQKCLSLSEAVKVFMSGDDRLSKLKEWGQGAGFTGRKLKTFLFWTIHKFEENTRYAFADFPAIGLSWSDCEETRWLRSSGGFISFMSKSSAGDLIDNLQNALQNWQPTPSRLLITKYRDAINKAGVESEDTSFIKQHAFALFYDSILNPTLPNVPASQAELLRRYRLRDHIYRLSEDITYQIEDAIFEFGTKIVEADGNDDLRFMSYYSVDLSDINEKRKAVAQYNVYVSTLPKKIKGHGSYALEQLDSGHIFLLGDEWWVCATPVCDLQPGQTSIAFKGSSDYLRPFVALRLEKVNIDEISGQHVNTGSYCFIEYDGRIISLGPRSLADERNPATQKVRWRIFIAKDGGKIQDGNIRLYELEMDRGILMPNHVEATVFGKLRYEYALNYIQLIGNSVSRIGLGYASFPSDG